MTNVTFPQANDLKKMFLIIKGHGSRTEKELMEQTMLNTPRQINYYRSAAVSLGFMSFKQGKYELTGLGQKVNSSTRDEEGTEQFYLGLLRSKIFWTAMVREKINMDQLSGLNGFEELSPSTKERRLAAVRSWHNQMSIFFGHGK